MCVCAIIFFRFSDCYNFVCGVSIDLIHGALFPPISPSSQNHNAITKLAVALFGSALKLFHRLVGMQLPCYHLFDCNEIEISFFLFLGLSSAFPLGEYSISQSYGNCFSPANQCSFLLKWRLFPPNLEFLDFGCFAYANFMLRRLSKKRFFCPWLQKKTNQFLLLWVKINLFSISFLLQQTQNMRLEKKTVKS